MPAAVAEPHGHDLVEHRELEVRVPLDRELVVGDGVEDPVQLVEHPLLVERLDAGLVLRRHERRDRRQRRGQRDLEPAVRRDLPVPLAAGEDAVGGDRRLGVAQVVEAQRVQRLAVADPQARQSRWGWSPAGRPRTPGGAQHGYCHTIQSDRGPVSPSGKA